MSPSHVDHSWDEPAGGFAAGPLVTTQPFPLEVIPYELVRAYNHLPPASGCCLYSRWDQRNLGKGSCSLLLEAALTKIHTCLGL